MLLAGLLVQDQGDAEPTQAHAGDETVQLHGELEEFEAPESWKQVRGALEGTTYHLVSPDFDGLVLLTGMEPGWDHEEVIAEATMILEAPHPEEAGQRVLVFRAIERPLLG